MIEDSELLRRYVEDDSEESFAELVRRHVNLVHSVALRQVNGDLQLAQDVTQHVFSDLARKAHTLLQRPVLSGWLFVSTRYGAAKLVRGERRRRAREQEAHMINTLLNEAGGGPEWERVRPVIDEALSELSETDREVILLRFFEGKNFAEVGSRLQQNENTARMRVERALDKLHALLNRRGVTSTTQALALALTQQAAAAAPAGLASMVTTLALTGAALGGAGAGATAAGTFMSITKLQIGLTGALAIAGASGIVLQEKSATRLRVELENLRKQTTELAALRLDNDRLRYQAEEARRLRAEEGSLSRLQAHAAELKRQLALQEQRAALAAEARRAQMATRTRRSLAGIEGKSATSSNLPDRMPQASFRTPPQYPADMRVAGITGTVVVSLVVDSDGMVRDAFPAKSTRPEFEAAAVQAIKQWKFDPGVKGGRFVNTRLELPITFSLAKNAGAPAVEAGELKPVESTGWF
jgi:RNA polymerase sigma factor (sigma-70 family)